MTTFDPEQGDPDIAPPLTAAGFRVLWRRAGAPARVIVAVSGGSDSIALMRLAAPLHGTGEAHILALTVDHGLRDGARAEALQVGRWARAAGVEHDIVDWRGDKPSSGVQAAARNARYYLLAREAERRGVAAILTAHTADDQAETVYMRMARKSGLHGLAGMAERTMIAAGAGAPVALLRPLLFYRRAELRDFLAAIGQPFVNDPSNEDDRFERVRVRRALAGYEAAGVTTAPALIAAADSARLAAASRDAVEDERFRERAGVFHRWGGASVAVDALSADRDAGLIARLVRAAGGGEHRPADAAAGAALAQALAGKKATLGGALMVRCGGRLFVMREPAAVLGRAGVAPLAPQALAPGDKVYWDGRFIVRNIAAEPAELRPLGTAAAKIEGEQGAPAAALSAAPGLWIRGALAMRAGDDGAAQTSFRALAEERFYRRVNRFHDNYANVSAAHGARLS